MVGLSPGLGPVNGYPCPIARVHVVVVFVLGNVPLPRFQRLDLVLGVGI